MLPDVQTTEPTIRKSIQKVGVRGIRLPVFIETKTGQQQPTVVSISSYCNLNDNIKGINMSRIGRTINKILMNQKMCLSNFETFVVELRDAHNTNEIYIKGTFPFFVNSLSPITNIPTFEPIEVTIETRMINETIYHFLTIEVVGMSLCPCSKEMSLLKHNITDAEAAIVRSLDDSLQQKIFQAGYGAHNQNSIIKATVELNLQSGELLWIEDFVEMMVKCFSAPTFNILKRPDEKYITEVSYLGGFYQDGCFHEIPNTGAKFVEDIARDAAFQLDTIIDKKISDYVVVVNNDESIHKDDIKAVAVISAGRRLK